MLISRRVLLTAVLGLALLASASVAGAGVTILSQWMGGHGFLQPSYVAGVGWSGGEGFYQDSYAVYHEDFDYWFSGGFSEEFSSYSTSNGIGFYREASYWMDDGWPTAQNRIYYEIDLGATFEITRPYSVDGWFDSTIWTAPDAFEMRLRDQGTGDFVWYCGSGSVLLNPGTYSYGAYPHYVFDGRDIGQNTSFSGHFDAGLQFTDPIPEPAYLSFVALAIFGLVAWRKSAKRFSV